LGIHAIMLGHGPPPTAWFAAWFVGRLIGDAWWWSQWLFWIPSVTVLALAALALAVRCVGGSAARTRGAAAQAVAILIALLAVLRSDLGVGVGAPLNAPDLVRVLQWNTNWPSSVDPRSMEALSRTNADIVLISNLGAITSPDQVWAWAGADARVVGAGPFALVTRWPVREAIQIAGGGGPGERWWVARFEVLPPGWDGVPLRIAMVDLPSRPSLSRSAVADVLLRACEEGALGEVDVVAGDFNATDGSVILQRCFPRYRDVLQEAGQGWLATWPRRFPLWRIDHLLIGSRIEALHGRTIDPGISSHRMTEGWLRTRRPPFNGSSR
jgi:endonuclease/exonuclease/phosphatase (EEP) superfamily protein YafD